MLIGLVLVAAGFFVAKLFELTTLSWLLDNLINYSIIFLIVIFQQDIRRGLMRVGQNLFARGRQYEETHVFEEVIKAAETLARSRIGGLIVLEREADLDEFLSEPGEILEARVSKEILVACFLPEPENTIHDGAVLIKNLRLYRAGCVLPLSANPKLDKQLGTRHRAAIGITEETDAVVVVVSEERGAVSLCFGGNIARDLDAATLRKALLGLFHKEKRTRPAQPEAGGRRRTDEPTGKTLTHAVGAQAVAIGAAASPAQAASAVVTQPMPTVDVTERESATPEVAEATDEAKAAVDPSKVN
jgi:uncharacterized protein (TIGR00159 family)